MIEACAAARWPTGGAVRVHYDPGALPHLADDPGANRFDDPRPRTIDRFLMRYAARTLRGCLLELLAGLREAPEVRDRERAIDTADPDFVEAPMLEDWQHIADFLDGRKAAKVAATSLSVVSINDPAIQHELDREPAVRAVLDSSAATTALLGSQGGRVHLDNAAVRLSSEVGRYVTQACSLALYDRQPPPDAIHYRSRHDDAEDCWAVYHHAEVTVGEPEHLSPEVEEHALALRSVAELWDLPLPPAWR